MTTSATGVSGVQNVLLVEDDAATRAMIARHLRVSGYLVTPMESAEQVLLATSERPLDFGVVISDVHLPGMSGIDLASWLLARNPSQPVVLITGDPDAALAREALSRGPVSYLLKPFELFELDAAVGAAMRHGPVEDRPLVSMDDAGSPDAGWIPDEWLAFVDERSQAGPGHADRVARLALLLADTLPIDVRELSATDLALAARMHELGRLSGPTAHPAEMAANGASLLLEAGYPPVLARAVRHLHERWDGTGGPDALAAEAIPGASILLSAADALDHYTGAWVRAGIEPAEAVRRALGLMEAQRGSVFGPVVADAVQRESDAIADVLMQRTADEDAELAAPARRLA